MTQTIRHLRLESPALRPQTTYAGIRRRSAALLGIRDGMERRGTGSSLNQTPAYVVDVLVSFHPCACARVTALFGTSHRPLVAASDRYTVTGPAQRGRTGQYVGRTDAQRT